MPEASNKTKLKITFVELEKGKKHAVFPKPNPSELNICSPNNGNAKPSNERKS
jgi:hypothetical protein